MKNKQEELKNNYFSSNNRFGILHIVRIILIIVSCVVATLILEGYLVSNLVRKQTEEQLDETTNQASINIKNTINDYSELLKTLSAWASSSNINNDNAKNILNELIDHSNFQKLEYCMMDGISIDVNGNTWDNSGYEYLDKGLQGQTGFCCANFIVGDLGTHLVFYTPIIIDDVQTGLLIGYCNEETMSNILDAYFYGNQARSFLCNYDGLIISSNRTYQDGDDLADYFYKNDLITLEKSEEIKEFFKTDLENSAFYYAGRIGESRASIKLVDGTSFYVVETYPSETFNNVIKRTESLSRIIIFIMTAIIAIISFFLFRNMLRNNKKLEKEYYRSKNIIDSANAISQAMIILDFNSGTYEVLASHLKISVPVKGEIDKYNAVFSNVPLFGEKNLTLDKALMSRNIKEILKDKEKEVYEFSVIDDSGKTNNYTLHIINISKKMEVIENVAIFILDVTSLKQRQSFQKDVMKTIFNTSFSSLGLVDVNDKKIEFKEPSVSGIFLDDEVLSYDDFIRKLSLYIVPEFKYEYYQCIKLNNIIEKLNSDDKYNVEFDLYKQDGSSGRYIFYFRYFNNKKTILFASEEITKDVDYDQLTGLYSDTGLVRVIKQNLKDDETTKEYVLVHANIKKFKGLKERFGNNESDEILRFIGNYLKNSNKNIIAISRPSSDRFNLFIEKEKFDINDVIALSTVYYEKQNINIHLTFGIFTFNNKVVSVNSVINKAMIAEENIKNEANKSTSYVIYNNKLNSIYLEKCEILEQLYNALDTNEFKVYYQPIYDAKTKKIISSEALARWIKRDGSIVYPSVFIPVLEGSGHISLLDYYVVENVTRFIDELNKDGKNINVAVNLSRVSALNYEIIEKMYNTFKNSPIDKSSIRLEITESGLIGLTNETKEILMKFNELGIRFMLDDFGSGYSSFASISEYEFSFLKIDASLTKGIGVTQKSELSIKTIIEYAHALNIKVVGEGVETEEQYQFLTNCGCDYIQGFLFSEAIDEETFKKLLK